ncbi:hypothetical protein D3C78_1693480 [compost metagenome]
MGKLIAQPGANASKQLIEAEGLHQIIIGAYCQSLHTVLDLILGCKHDDSDVIPCCPKRPAYFKAVHSRHHNIQNNNMRMEGSRELYGCLSIIRYADVVAFIHQTKLKKL